MTVKELIALLQKQNGDDLVILASDEEGNDFHMLHEVTVDMFSFEEQALALRELTPELRNEGYSEEDLGSLDNGDVNCITLWP